MLRLSWKYYAANRDATAIPPTEPPGPEADRIKLTVLQTAPLPFFFRGHPRNERCAHPNQEANTCLKCASAMTGSRLVPQKTARSRTRRSLRHGMSPSAFRAEPASGTTPENLPHHTRSAVPKCYLARVSRAPPEAPHPRARQVQSSRLA